MPTADMQGADHHMEDARPTVYLFTETYPFPGPDDPFLPAELAVLGQWLDVRLIPTLATDGDLPVLPPGVVLDPRLASWMGSRRARVVGLLRSVVSRALYSELWRQRPKSMSVRGTATILARLARALTVRRWVRRELASVAHDGSTVLYCWWSAAYAVGVAMAVARWQPHLVARAHGFDLYAEQESVGFVPFQEVLLSRCDAVLSASRAGEEYLKSRYPRFSARISTSYLGVSGGGDPNPGSADGVLRVLTCSGVVPVKRIDLMVDALVCLAEREPELPFHWTHVGGGPQWDALSERVSTAAAIAGRTTLTGAMDPEAVRDWLASHPVDVFVNVSSSEGLPVALMEAASMGIPMLGTSVGGIPEIIDGSDGWLLPQDPAPEQVADALARFGLLDSHDRNGMRSASRAMWASHFSAEVNYREFASLLARLATARRT